MNTFPKYPSVRPMRLDSVLSGIVHTSGEGLTRGEFTLDHGCVVVENCADRRRALNRLAAKLRAIAISIEELT